MEDAEKYFDEKSKRYDEISDALYFRVYNAITWKYLEPYVPIDPNALVLDAGGGTGRWAIQMATKGCKVVLIDYSSGMLEAAGVKVKQQNLQNRVALKKCSITDTGYADETFDMVLCEHALFLFKNPDVVIAELRRVLKKKAPLVISAQNRYVQALSALPGKPTSDNVGKAMQILTGERRECMTKDGKIEICTWTPDEFKTILQRNGLCVEKIVGKGITMPLRIKQELFMEKKFPQKLFNQIMQFELALCEKPDALALAGHMQAIAFKV